MFSIHSHPHMLAQHSVSSYHRGACPDDPLSASPEAQGPSTPAAAAASDTGQAGPGHGPFAAAAHPPSDLFTLPETSCTVSAAAAGASRAPRPGRPPTLGSQAAAGSQAAGANGASGSSGEGLHRAGPVKVSMGLDDSYDPIQAQGSTVDTLQAQFSGMRTSSLGKFKSSGPDFIEFPLYQ